MEEARKKSRSRKWGKFTKNYLKKTLPPAKPVHVHCENTDGNDVIYML